MLPRASHQLVSTSRRLGMCSVVRRGPERMFARLLREDDGTAGEPESASHPIRPRPRTTGGMVTYMPSLTRCTAAVALTFTLALSLPGSSSAQNWSHNDAVGDVVTFSGQGNPTGSTRTKGDVLRASISHTRTKVVIRLRMNSIPTDKWIAMATVKTPRASFLLTYTSFNSDKSLSIDRIETGERIHCARKSFRIDGTALVVTAARRCIGNPRWIRVRAGVTSFDDVQSQSTSSYDDGLTGGASGASRFSPRLRPS